MKLAHHAVLLALLSGVVEVQAQGTPDNNVVTPPLVAMPVTSAVPDGHLLVPRNTPVYLAVNSEVSSKSFKEGDTFTLSVSQDVVVDNYIVIPKGSRAVAEITWHTGKGAFGKSAKMDFQFRYLELGSRRIALEGKQRIEGKGNSGATVGAVVAVGVFGGFVTGKSAVIAQGREFIAHTNEDFTVAVAAAPAPAAVAASAFPATGSGTVGGETQEKVQLAPMS